MERSLARKISGNVETSTCGKRSQMSVSIKMCFTINVGLEPGRRNKTPRKKFVTIFELPYDTNLEPPCSWILMKVFSGVIENSNNNSTDGTNRNLCI